MNISETAALLRSRRIRATRKKTAILREIHDCGRPLNASELYERVSEELPVDLATVYRTLNAFSKKGLVREISDGSGAVSYEIACVHNPVHPHFKCVRCRRISCLDTLTVESEAVVKEYASGCEIEEISITLSGTCEDCRRKDG